MDIFHECVSFVCRYWQAYPRIIGVSCQVGYRAKALSGTRSGHAVPKAFGLGCLHSPCGGSTCTDPRGARGLDIMVHK